MVEEMTRKVTPPKGTMTVADFAAEMGWDHSTVLRAIRAGRVKVENQAADGLLRVKAYFIPISEVQRIRDEAKARREAQASAKTAE
jgi:hypothetical protein